MDNTINYLTQAGVIIKIVYNIALAIASAVAVHLGLDVSGFGYFVILIAIDMLIGPVHARLKGINFSISIWKMGAYRKMSLLFFPVIVALMQLILNTDSQNLNDFAISVITLTVGYGVLQNLYSIYYRGEKSLPDIDFLSALADKVISSSLKENDKKRD